MIGRSLGHYEVVELLGSGGMGEVYRARDPRLKREVAIKVLPEAFAADPERLARLEREAHLLAALSHPNVATIHGLEEDRSAVEDDGSGTGATVRFLVLELVEGETLADRLRSGPLDLEAALQIAHQIAEGLEAAHAKGILHRDLKPANVAVTAEGRVKLLDFGLAKPTPPAGADHGVGAGAETGTGTEAEAAAGTGGAAGAALSHSPTATVAATEAGVLLGTAPYMSPEQVRGHILDKRTDVWSFGCVLYEMLAGKRAFSRETVSDTLAAILKEEPDWEALPTDTPPSARRLLQRCLSKDPRKRLHDIADARIEIGDALHEPATAAARAVPGWRRMAPWVLAGVTSVVAAVVLLFVGPRPAPEVLGPMVRSSTVLPPEAPLAPAGSFFLAVGRPSLALSPDGSTLVYVALVGEARQLYRRDMRSGETRPMPGTEDAQGPFFSPDSEWVGFFAGGKLKKIAAAGGAPEVVADAVWGSGADWGADGQIYFAPTEAVGVWRVPSSEGSAGGSAEPVVLPPVAGHPWPALLPGNQRLLVNYGDPAVSVAVAAVGGSTPPEILVDFGSAARYAPTGHLVYGREGRLVARPFDAETIRFTGDEATLFDGVRMESAGAVQATWSADGTLVYAPGSDGARGELVWIDRQQGRAPLGLQAAFYGDFELSPDGSALVYVLREGTRQRLWLYPLDRAAPQPLTQGPSERGPHWDIEGDALFFHASDPEGNHLYRIVVTDAAEAPLEVTRPAGVLSVLAVRDDGLFLVSGDDMGTDIVFAPFGDDRASLRLDESRMVVATAAREIFPNVSPDGRWLAYTSDETGGWEIYVTNLPDATIKRRVSLGGGEEPRWSPDGREIIYRYGPRWYSVSFSAEPGLELGSSTLLFEGPFINVPGYSWDISRDGGRFLVIENPDQDQALTELTMISNFFDELRRKAPSRR